MFNDWIELVKIIAKHLTTHHTLASIHQVDVTLQGVDLSIVSNKPLSHTQTNTPTTKTTFTHQPHFTLILPCTLTVVVHLLPFLSTYKLMVSSIHS